MNDTPTVATYLKTRLEQLGLDRMFGVAGNYTAALLDTILADPDSPIQISGNANELCAGYAADAYARYKGVGALYVTYSVGAFSLLNCIAGSYTELAPVILINGAPTNKEDQIEKNAGLLYSHTTGYQSVDIHMFRPITAAAERITDARRAPFQIDSALTALLTDHRPVYLEVTEDVWRTECPPPQGELTSGRGAFIKNSETADAVTATLKLIQSRSKAIFWAGVELQRFGLQDEFLDLLAVANDEHALPDKPIHFVTSPLSKSVISEQHAHFEGCVTMSKSNIYRLLTEQELSEADDADNAQILDECDGVLIGIGAWTVGKDVHNQNIRSSNTILASHGGVLVGAYYYPIADLGEYIEQLRDALRELAARERLRLAGLRIQTVPPLLQLARTTENELTYDRFVAQLSGTIDEKHILIADAGFPLISVQGVPVPARNGFVGQAAWLSIGFSVGAATGAKCANPDKRVLVVVGDGAFHETCQAVSDQASYGHNTVVFVMSNGIYGIEQYLVNPNPFRGADKKDYDDGLFNTVFTYNELPRWDFIKLAEAFGAQGRRVTTTDELSSVLSEVREDATGHYLVEVVIPKTDSPKAIRKGAAASVGEDEIPNPAWPPAEKF